MDTGLRLQSLGLADPGTGNTPGLWSLECLWTWDSVLAVRLWSPKHLWTLESVLVVRLWSLEYLGTLESVLVVRFWSLEKL